MSEFKINGNSGCDLTIFEENGQLFVRKSSPSSSYNVRLKKQCVKQKQCHDNNAIKSITVPDAYFDMDNNQIIMPYVYGQSFIDKFEHSTVEDVNYILNTLYEFINNELEQCELKPIDKEVFIKKLMSIREAGTSNVLVNNEDLQALTSKAIKYITSLNEDICLPVNVCHGDLTFSNIIFTNSKLCLIDFLDSFVETPLQDIIKLRQDTLYRWSLMMAKELDNYNSVRIMIILKYMDSKIDEEYTKYDWYVKYYNFLQFINILRIVPYVKTQEIYKYLINILQSIEL